MSHLSEKTAEFVLGELSATEMADARLHLADCLACRQEVEQFQLTHAMLRTSPDVEPPRRIIFETEKPSWIWRWLVPVAAAAAVVLAVLAAAPIDIRWQDSQVTIAFGKIPQTATPAPVIVKESVVQPVDYEKIVAALRESQQAALVAELNRRDAAHTREIQRMNGELAYLENMQRVVLRETMDNSSSIQLLAKGDSQD